MDATLWLFPGLHERGEDRGRDPDVGIGIIGASAVLAITAALTPRQEPRDFSAAVAVVFLVFPHFMGWVLIWRLTKGRPGFPFYLLYTRPIRTGVMVGLPMAYLTVIPPAIYLVSALLLRMTSGYPFPLLPVAAWLAALNVIYLAINWSTRSPAVMGRAALVMLDHAPDRRVRKEHGCDGSEAGGSIAYPNGAAFL